MPALRRRRERDRSREMAAYVGYDAMYKDGIAQVMPGVFSQTVEFSDISYQYARKESRETTFTVMNSLFNYFPADSHVQLQVVNAPIPADEVGRKVFFEPGRRATAGLAAEYNRILNDKMREGVSNLVRHRYLTYAVGADDVDATVPKLARIRGDGDQAVGREARAARERRDQRKRIRGLESLAVATCRISQSTKSNQDGELGGECRALLPLLSFYSPLHTWTFSACLGGKCCGGLHDSTQYVAVYRGISLGYSRFP